MQNDKAKQMCTRVVSSRLSPFHKTKSDDASNQCEHGVCCVVSMRCVCIRLNSFEINIIIIIRHYVIRCLKNDYNRLEWALNLYTLHTLHMPATNNVCVDGYV